MVEIDQFKINGELQKLRKNAAGQRRGNIQTRSIGDGALFIYGDFEV